MKFFSLFLIWVIFIINWVDLNAGYFLRFVVWSFFVFIVMFGTWWIFLLLSLEGLFRKISFGELIQDFSFSGLSGICWGRIVFGDLFDSSLLIFFIELTNSICNALAINDHLPKLVVGMMKIDFLGQIKLKASDECSLCFHILLIGNKWFKT